jgi:membrane protein implicated in regulation of membrane protease activity
MNLIIGLCFGIASAVALMLMWRMAEKLRSEMRSRENPHEEQEVTQRVEAVEDLTGDT